MFSRVILRYNNNFRCRTINGSGNIRQFAIQSSVQPDIKSENAISQNTGNTTEERTDPEWVNAKPFSAIPAPSRFYFIRNMLPGGKFYNASLVKLQCMLCEIFGPMVFMRGNFGRRDMLFTFDADDFEKVFRTEGIWPIRHNLDTFNYYRKELRGDVFKDTGGLLSEQGKKWADVRTQVNPIMLKPKNIKYYIPQIDQIAKEFLQRIKTIRDPQTLEIPPDFEDEANRWSLESVAAVALNTRLGLIRHELNMADTSKGELMMEGVKDFFQLSYDLDFLPSIWKYYKTPKFNKLMSAFDKMTNVSLHYINETEKIYLEEKKNNQLSDDNRSILAQLLEVNRTYAIIMAMDLLLAGVDTTSSALINTMYKLAKHPEKQEKLREEVNRVLPEKTSDLTEESMRNMPYLRACFKETMRLVGITNGTIRETIQDLVLSGYKIPKGTNVVLAGGYTSLSENYFPRPEEFIPERWLREDPEQNCPVGKSTNPFAYIPFGFGPRMCIGKRLAELETETVILRLIRNFRIEWHHDDLKYRNNIINTPTGDMRFKFVDVP